MSIENITGMGAISGYNEENARHDHQDEAASEDYILEYLGQNYSLGRAQAAAVLAAVLGCGSSVQQLASGLQNGDRSVVALFETYIL